MKVLIVLAFVSAVTLGQQVEERTIKNPDGTTTQVRSYSHSSFHEESVGPDGTIVGRTVFKDNTGNYGNQYKVDKTGKVIENAPLAPGEADALHSRSKLTGDGFVSPAANLPAFQIPDFSKIMQNFHSDLARRVFVPPVGNTGAPSVSHSGSETALPLTSRSSYHTSSSYSSSSNTGSSGQKIESRSGTVAGSDGFSRATFREENVDSDGIVTGRTVYRDHSGAAYGNQYKIDKTGKVIENRPLGADEANSMITSRTRVIPGLGSSIGQLPAFHVPDFSQMFGPNSAFAGGFGAGGFGPGFGSNFGAGLGPGFGSPGGFGASFGSGSGFGPGFGNGVAGRSSYSNSHSYSRSSHTNY